MIRIKVNSQYRTEYEIRDHFDRVLGKLRYQQLSVEKGPNVFEYAFEAAPEFGCGNNTLREIAEAIEHLNRLEGK